MPNGNDRCAAQVGNRLLFRSCNQPLNQAKIKANKFKKVSKKAHWKKTMGGEDAWKKSRLVTRLKIWNFTDESGGQKNISRRKIVHVLKKRQSDLPPRDHTDLTAWQQRRPHPVQHRSNGRAGAPERGMKRDKNVKWNGISKLWWGRETKRVSKRK